MITYATQTLNFKDGQLWIGEDPIRLPYSFAEFEAKAKDKIPGFRTLDDHDRDMVCFAPMGTFYGVTARFYWLFNKDGDLVDLEIQPTLCEFTRGDFPFEDSEADAKECYTYLLNQMDADESLHSDPLHKDPDRKSATYYNGGHMILSVLFDKRYEKICIEVIPVRKDN